MYLLKEHTALTDLLPTRLLKELLKLGYLEFQSVLTLYSMHISYQDTRGSYRKASKSLG